MKFRALAVLRSEAPPRLREIFPAGVPVLSGESHLGELTAEKGPASVEPVYLLDVDWCSHEQLAAVAEYVIGQCGGATARALLSSIRLGAIEMPLRASLVLAVITPIGREMVDLSDLTTTKGGTAN